MHYFYIQTTTLNSGLKKKYIFGNARNKFVGNFVWTETRDAASWFAQNSVHITVDTAQFANPDIAHMGEYTSAQLKR